MAANTKIVITFTQLCDVFEKVRASKLKNEKMRLLQTFVDKCKNDCKVENAHDGELNEMMHSIFRLILPNLAEGNKETCTSMANLYARVYFLPKNSSDYKNLVSYRDSTSDRFEENDFSERAYFVFKKIWPKHSTKIITITDIKRFLDDISNKTIVQQKVDLFRIMFKQLCANEIKWLTRILLRNLQLGVRTEDILNFFDTESCGTSCSKLAKYKRTTYSSMKIGQNIELFTHFDPMLLERLNISDVHKLFLKSTLEYYVQIKYDGERSQIHMSQGRFKYFTRKGIDITKKPLLGETGSSGYLSEKFTHFLDSDCSSFILDGEMMVWDKRQKILLTQAVKDVKSLPANGPYRPCFIAFDIVMLNHTTLLDTPYHERLKLLKNVLAKAHGAVNVCEFTLINNRKSLEDIFRRKCLQEKEEGIVVKRSNFLYKPSVRNGGGCYKIKAEFSDNLVEDLDLIILGGCYQKYKSPKKLNRLLMGAAISASNKQEHPSSFIQVLSVSTGISNEEWDFLEKQFSSKWLKERPASIVNSSKKFQMDVWLHPQDSIILTIRASEMVPNEKYPIKYSFRFSRVVRIRTDKPWHDVCTNCEILSLVKKEGKIHKLLREKADLSDEVPKDTWVEPRVRTRTRPQNEQIANSAFKKQVIHTRLLEGKEVCVINGTEDLSKEDIQETLSKHSASNVEYPRSTTYCTIVGDPTTVRALDIIKNHDNVVSVDWFLRITDNLKSSVSIYPWELLRKPSNTPDSSEEYDMYFDYYHIDATPSTLKHSFARIDELDRSMKIVQSPYERLSHFTFRGVNGFFTEQMTLEEFLFCHQEGTIKPDFDNSVTHVFVQDETDHIASDLKMYKQAGAKIVKAEWITECSFHNKLLGVEDYLIDLRNSVYRLK